MAGTSTLAHTGAGTVVMPATLTDGAISLAGTAQAGIMDFSASATIPAGTAAQVTFASGGTQVITTSSSRTIPNVVSTGPGTFDATSSANLTLGALSGAGTLNKTGNGTLTLPATISSGAITNTGASGTIDFSATTGTLQAVTFAGASTIITNQNQAISSVVANAAATLNVSAGTTLTVSALTGAAALLKTGVGTVALVGNLSSVSGINAGGGTVALAAVTTSPVTPAITVSATSTITSGALTIASLVKATGATAILTPAAGVNQTITALTGNNTGNVTVTGANASTSQVTLGSGLPDGAGNYSVTAGILTLANTAATGTPSGTFSVGATGILDCATNSVILANRFPSGTLSVSPAGGVIRLGSGVFAKAISFA